MDVKLFINNISPDSPTEHPELIFRMERITSKS
jgi:hypothetical protein